MEFHLLPSSRSHSLHYSSRCSLLGGFIAVPPPTLPFMLFLTHFLSKMLTIVCVFFCWRRGGGYQDMEEANEETGWKLVHGDVLRPPTTFPMLFAVSTVLLHQI